MNYKIVRKMPPVDEILGAYPLSDPGAAGIERNRAEIRAILSGEDHRMLVVVGLGWEGDRNHAAETGERGGSVDRRSRLAGQEDYAIPPCLVAVVAP